jgi:DNA mismatch endonuclease, patch repair protein
MARVKRRDTRPERMLRSALHAAGLRFRVDRRIDGVHADIVFPAVKVAIFVDGCFWHSCPTHATTPKSNASYWLPKLEENRQRDLRQTASLRRNGWLVIRVWEHDCRLPADRLIRRIIAAISRRR